MEVERTRTEALDRARRFLKLGFVVHQIRDAKGAVFMDETEITQHLGEASSGSLFWGPHSER